MKKPVSDHGFFIARYKRPFTPALSLQEKEPTEVSGVFHRPESAVDYGFSANLSSR